MVIWRSDIQGKMVQLRKWANDRNNGLIKSCTKSTNQNLILHPDLEFQNTNQEFFPVTKFFLDFYRMVFWTALLKQISALNTTKKYAKFA